MEDGKKCGNDISPALMLSKMVAKQGINKPRYMPSKFMSRKPTIDWMCETAETIGISPDSIHKSAVYFDLIFSENTIEESEMQTVGLMCMLISAKLGEADPEVDRIKALFKNRLGIRGYQLMKKETYVLTLLHWELQCVTVMDFIGLFVAQGVVFTNDKIMKSTARSKTPSPKVASAVRKYAEFFADMCLQRPSLLSMETLYLAAGIIALSRKQMKLAEVWNKELSMMTGVQFAQVEGCMERIEKCYLRMFPKTVKVTWEEKENCVMAAKTARVSSVTRMYSTFEYKYNKKY